MDKLPERSGAQDAATASESADINALIRAGQFDQASIRLQELVSKNSSSNADKLWAYGMLIRIAAEMRVLEKISGYIEKIKGIPLKTDDEKATFVGCLYSTGIAWSYLGNHEEARKSFEQAFSIAEKLSHQDWICKIRIALAEVLRAEGRYEEILNQWPALQLLASESKDPGKIAAVWMLAGNVRRKLGQYREALTAFESAKDYYAQNKSSSEYHYVLWAIGTCYAALEDKEKAVIYLDLARNNSQGMQFWRIKILSSLTLAELHTVTGDFTPAEAIYKKITEEVGTDENSYYGRRLLRGQTLLHIKEGEFEKANELIDRLVVIAVKEKNQKDIMRLRLLKAEVLLRTGDAVQQDEARDMLQEALAFFRERGIRRHQAVALELLARLDSRSGYPADALRKVDETLKIAEETSFERLVIRAYLARLVLQRKLGQNLSAEQLDRINPLVNRLNGESERVVIARFRADTYEAWTQELRKLDAHSRRYVNEFFEDFHFVPQQSIDIEIDRNSHYIREKHLGEIPFHNKFTLMRILCLLAETPGKEFSKEQLAKEIWGQEYNPLRHDNNIYININRLRKLIEPNPRESRYIMNGPRGYYFNPEMKVNISSKISDVAPRAVGPATAHVMEDL